MDYEKDSILCQASVIFWVFLEKAYVSFIDKCILSWKTVMTSFLSDWRPATSSAESEAFVISGCYEWGTPWPRAKSRGTGRGEASPVRNTLK
jgi:hypothetical protein